MTRFSNIPFDQIEVGQSITVSRTVARTDLEALYFVSGDITEGQVGDGPELAERAPTAESVAAEAFFSYLLNRRLPGPGTTILSQNLTFHGTIAVGDTIAATVTAREKRPEGQVVVFDCRCTNQAGAVLASGTATAGIVLGARVPIVLTSRADSVRTRLASAAVMARVAHARRPTTVAAAAGK